MNQEDEILIWKYLDGEANAQESETLLRRVANDAVLKSELEWATQMDAAMVTDKRHTVSTALRLQILQQATTQEKTQRTSSERWMNPGLKFFAFFNFSVLLLGLLFSYLAPINAASDKVIDAWSMFFQLFKTPIAQTILMLCTGVFVLLIFDQWLNNHGQRRLTTPV